MDDSRSRLLNCFRLVFPSLSDSQLSGASQDNLDSWDSVAAITLVNVIEEEFQVQMDFDALADLNSFDRVYQYLQKQPGLS